MPVEAFFDTNILVYAMAEDDARSVRARQLLARGGYVSVQVLNEFVNVSRRKLKLSWDEVDLVLEAILALVEPPVELSLRQHKAALTICRLFQYTIYDAMILSSAIEAGCKTLLSEDLQHGQMIAGLRIVNPFLHVRQE